MSTIDLKALVRHMAAEALNAEADVAQGATRELVPRDSTELARSIEVTTEATPASLVAQLSTNEPYAIYQHEALHLHHDDGQAKFMEVAVTDSSSLRAMTQAALRAARQVAG